MHFPLSLDRWWMADAMVQKISEYHIIDPDITTTVETQAQYNST